MFTATYESQDVALLALPIAPAAQTLFPNLDTPSESGRDGVADQLHNELALDDIKPSSLPPNKRRKLILSSPAIPQVVSLSPASQASPPLNRDHSLELTSFAGGDAPLYSDSPLDKDSSPENALDLALAKVGPSKLLYISPPTNHGGPVMADRLHDDGYTPSTLVNTQRDKHFRVRDPLGEFHSSEISQQQEFLPPESTDTSSSSSLAPLVSRLKPTAHPTAGRSTRVSTQLLTHRSKQLAAWGTLVTHGGLAAHRQLGTRNMKTNGVLSPFVKTVEEPGRSAYHAQANELELWASADVSPVVFGKRKFAPRLSEEEFKNAVTFNLRHLLSKMEEMNDTQHLHKRPSVTAMAEKPRKHHISMIIADALELEEQPSAEETSDGLWTDVPNDLRGRMDTPTSTTDNYDSATTLPDSYNSNLRPAQYNTHSLSFQNLRHSFPPLSRYNSSLSIANIQRNIIGELTSSNPLLQTPPIPAKNGTQSTGSHSPYEDDSINSAISSARLHGQGHTGRLPEEVPGEPLQAAKEPVPAMRGSSVEVTELINSMIVDEDCKTAHSPPAQSLPPLRQDVILTILQPPCEGQLTSPLPRGDDTPSSLFGSTHGAEKSIDSPPPSEAIHNAPPTSVSLSEDDLETPSEDLPGSPPRKFFHGCAIQPSEDALDTTVLAPGIVFRRFPNAWSPIGPSWPSPAAPEDHPYLREARSLMVTTKLREDITPLFVVKNQQGTEADGDSGTEGESEIEDVDELDERVDSDPIEGEGTEDELDTLSVFQFTPVSTGQHDSSLPGWDAYMTPSRHGDGFHRRVDGWESISTSGARGRFNTAQQSTHAPPAVSPIHGDDHDSDQAEDGDDQINHEDQLEDWATSLQTLVKGKRVLSPEELLNLKIVLNAVYRLSPTISPPSELAQTVLQVAKLEAKDIPNQDSLGLRRLARKSLRVWGLSTRTKT